VLFSPCCFSIKAIERLPFLIAIPDEKFTNQIPCSFIMSKHVLFNHVCLGVFMMTVMVAF
jgi:hypothetical protein